MTLAGNLVRTPFFFYYAILYGVYVVHIFYKIENGINLLDAKGNKVIENLDNVNNSTNDYTSYYIIIWHYKVQEQFQYHKLEMS